MPLPGSIIFPHLTQFQIPGAITEFQAVSDDTGEFYTASPPNLAMVRANGATYTCSGRVGSVFEGESVTCHVPFSGSVFWCDLDLRSFFVSTVPTTTQPPERNLGFYADHGQVDFVTVSLDIHVTGDAGSSGCALTADGAPQCGALDGAVVPDAAFSAPSFTDTVWEEDDAAAPNYTGFLKRTDGTTFWPYQYDPVNGAYLFTPEELAGLRIRTPNPSGAWRLNTDWRVHVVGYKWQPGYDPGEPPRLMMVI